MDKSLRLIALIIALVATGGLHFNAFAQSTSIDGDTIYSPNVIYSPIPKVYEIADIKVSGIDHVDDYVIIGYSGLSVGEKIEIPGDGSGSFIIPGMRE